MQRTFRPSQATYWGNCAAYQRFTEHIVSDEPSDAAREGTCAAWGAEIVFNSTDLISCDDLIGKTHENGWTINETMALDVQEYVDLVRSQGGVIIAEEHVRASENPLIEGTLDSSVSQVIAGILKINDLKYGRRIVEVRGCRQLICYGFGKLLKLPVGTVKEIHLSIYQPRAFHKDGIYRTWVLTPEQLQAEFMKLWNMAVEGLKPDSLATPGPHCRDCDVAASCEALTHSVYEAIHIIQSRNRRDMTPKELSAELNFVHEVEPMITAKFKAVKAEGEARCKKGSVPGWGLQPKKGNRVFTVSPVNIHLMTGIDPTAKSVCTPLELERRGADIERVKTITKQSITGHKLTRITSDDIASVFNAAKGK